MKSGAEFCFSEMGTKNVKELLEMGLQFDKNLQSWCQSRSILILLYLHFYILLHLPIVPVIPHGRQKNPVT